MEKLVVVELNLNEMINIEGGRISFGFAVGYTIGFISGTFVSLLHGFQEGLQAA